MATDVDVTAQAEIVLGGRGLESIDTVTHYPDRDVNSALRVIRGCIRS